MAVKKSNIFGIALLLALATNSISFANGANNLTQLDLKRSSGNSVNVTLFTSNGYNDNVMVRKKSDNKYVILIPKVQSAGYSSSNLSGVRDLVSNVDVKTVNDTSGGYTKVTLITTKPLDIKTSTQKSAPVTDEQKEYKTLIAQANAVKNHSSEPHKTPQKTEITVNKGNAVQPKPANNSKNLTTQKKENNVTKTTTSSANKQEQVKQKPNIKLNEVTPQTKDVDRQARRAQLAELINEVKQEKTVEKAPQTNIVPEAQTVVGTTFSEPVKDISEIPKQQTPNFWTKFKHIAKKCLKVCGFGVLGLFGLSIILNIIKAIATNSQRKESFINELSQNQVTPNNVKYNNIVNNNNLSWQDKYKSYLDASAKPVSRPNNKGNYTFIKTPAEPTKQLNQKRQALEKMVSDVINTNNNSIEPEIVEIQNEDDAIQKTIKFKAFNSRKTSLEMSNRDKIKSRFKKYEQEIPLHEQKNIELGKSLLHSNPRKLKDANLDVEDVSKNRIKFKPSEYIMSSVDEYFSILDKENAAQPVKEEIQQQAPTSIANNLTSPQSQRPMTNPIAQQKKDSKNSYINGLIIKSGYNIDNNKGFYVVNLDGKSALIGKVNDEVFVLKKFDANVTNPIQVRHDNANVYMVKAGGFKSLVEVTDQKMGVLIEL